MDKSHRSNSSLVKSSIDEDGKSGISNPGFTTDSPRREARSGRPGLERDESINEEMERLFETPDRFNFSSISSLPQSVDEGRRFNEADYQTHRESAHPQPSGRPRPKKGRNRSEGRPDSDSSDEDDGDTAGKSLLGVNSDAIPEEDEDESRRRLIRDSNPDNDAPDGGRRVNGDSVQLSDLSRDHHSIPAPDEPVLSHPGDRDIPDDDDQKRSKVKFELGGQPDSRPQEENLPKHATEPHHHHHRHHHQRNTPSSGHQPKQRHDDDGDDEPHQHDIESHRYDDQAGLRRHKIKAKSSVSSVVLQRDDDHRDNKPLQLKRIYDHSPHEIFVELDELHGAGGELEWKETARWIKYEEDLEEDTDRWGRPHVASLSFHSLMEVRRYLERGVFLLDLAEKDMSGIINRVVDQLVIADMLDERDKGAILRSLMLRHHHVNESSHRKSSRGFLNYVRRNTFSNLTLSSDQRNPSATSLESTGKSFFKRKSSFNDPQMTNKKDSSNGLNKMDHTLNINDNYNSSSEDLRHPKDRDNIMRRIPYGAEATTVQVGGVDFLEDIIVAFVRLAEGVVMPHMTEVPIPVRFMFILLGPMGHEAEYHETGRSFSTLMSSPTFYTAAYACTDRMDMMIAFKEFLDDTIVLPPGEWDKNRELLQMHTFQEQTRIIQERKQQQMSKYMEQQTQQETKLPLAALPPVAMGPSKKKSEEEEDDPLERTKKPFGGFIKDIKRRYPWYWSDFKDFLNVPCFSAAFFIFFAALSGAITFGGLMGEKTEAWIGISETLISTSIAGIIFALFSAQPSIIVGTTGPVLLFDEALYAFCKSNGIDFLSMRVWIGFWLVVVATIVVGFEGSVLVKKCTRFTIEIFSALISILFIFESLSKLYKVYVQHPVISMPCTDPLLALLSSSSNGSDNGTSRLEASANMSRKDLALLMIEIGPDGEPMNQPNTALLSTILMFGTYYIANFLRQFRNSKYLGRRVRRMLGDFGVPIAILLMVTMDVLIADVYTSKLSVPRGLTPSNPAIRGWFISPGGALSPSVIFGALLGALLIFIVIFMETEICELIMNKKERNLKKGSGHHLDIWLICFINAICSLFGAPWMCAATIRSVSHVSALTVMSRTHAPGEKPTIIHVYEQRGSALFVSIMLGLSVVLSPFLELVPVAVVFGVFLYMGISSMAGVQLFERIRLFFVPVKHFPQEQYATKVRTWKMHLFTVIQVILLGLLLAIKFTPIAIAFPFFLMMLVPIKIYCLKWIFTFQEITALEDEGERDENYEDEDERDFFEESHNLPHASEVDLQSRAV